MGNGPDNLVGSFNYGFPNRKLSYSNKAKKKKHKFDRTRVFP